MQSGQPLGRSHCGRPWSQIQEALASELPLGSQPLPSAFNCAEVSGGRVWEPAKGKVRWISLVSRRCFCSCWLRAAGLASPQLALCPGSPGGSGCVQHSRFLPRRHVRESSCPCSPGVHGSEFGGREAHMDTWSSEWHRALGGGGCSIL